MLRHLRLRRAPRTPRTIGVTLYTRPGCHLCEDARSLLESFQSRYVLSIDEVDITSDSDLVGRYELRIPVLAFADGPELGAPIEERALRRTLASLASQR